LTNVMAKVTKKKQTKLNITALFIKKLLKKHYGEN